MMIKNEKYIDSVKNPTIFGTSKDLTVAGDGQRTWYYKHKKHLDCTWRGFMCACFKNYVNNDEVTWVL